ncbi:MAG: hypothetical protein LBH97_02960 [Treponema sp.]|nr:hypothetical protein [Treponema sp.]
MAKIWMSLPAEPRPAFPLQPGMRVLGVSSGRELQTIFATAADRLRRALFGT